MRGEMIFRLSRAAFWAALAFAYVCAVMPAGPEIGGNDKIGHLAAFITLAALARLGWPARRALMVAVALVVFGVFIELSQATSLVHRDADVRDVVADTIGIAGGMVLGFLLLWIVRRLDPPGARA